MSGRTFRKKPVVIEAIQWTGKNADELVAWSGGQIACGRLWAVVETLEGEMRGDAQKERQ